MERPDNLPKLDFSKLPYNPRTYLGFPENPNFLTYSVDDHLYNNEMQRLFDDALDSMAKHIAEAKDNYILKGLNVEQLTKLRDMCDTEIGRRKNNV